MSRQPLVFKKSLAQNSDYETSNDHTPQRMRPMIESSENKIHKTPISRTQNLFNYKMNPVINERRNIKREIRVY